MSHFVPVSVDEVYMLPHRLQYTQSNLCKTVLLKVRLALSRITNPFSEHDEPRQNHLLAASLDSGVDLP
jgi:hypothetical protein